MLGPRMRIDGAREDAIERIIVFSGDRVEFVPVASRASECKPEEGLAEVIERILDRDMLQILRADADPP